MKNNKFNFTRSIILTGILLLSLWSATARAQSEIGHELSVYGKGMFNRLKYDIDYDATNENKNSAAFGLQYTLSITSKWSIASGMDFMQFNSTANLLNFNDFYNTTDIEGENFNFRIVSEKFSEQQKVKMINIPLLLKYQAPSPFANTVFFAAAGLQLGIPVYSKFKTTVHDLETTGYYTQWDALLESPRFMGFGNWGTLQGISQNLDISNNFSLLLETGLKMPVNEKQSLSCGLYADLGLNQLNKMNDSTSALIEYNATDPTNFTYNSIFTSSPHSKGKPFGDQLKTRSFGLKIQYAFKL